MYSLSQLISTLSLSAWLMGDRARHSEFINTGPHSEVLNPNGNRNKCLDVQGGVFADGTPVQIYDCNGTPAQMWSITRGNTVVRVWGTNYCLDAGSSKGFSLAPSASVHSSFHIAPANGVKMKIWTCYDSLPAQEWYWTDDNRIALRGKGLCLDLTDGSLSNGNIVQTWQCSDGNPNQVWI